MRKLLLLFLCTIVPAVVSAQRLDVTGRVLVKDTGKPIGQAVVELPQSGLWAVLSVLISILLQWIGMQWNIITLTAPFVLSVWVVTILRDFLEKSR